MKNDLKDRLLAIIFNQLINEEDLTERSIIVATYEDLVKIIDQAPDSENDS